MPSPVLPTLRRRDLALAAVLLVAASCSGEASADGVPTVGVTLLTQQHDFYKDLEGALRAAAEEAGLRVLVDSAEHDPSRQTAQIENFVTRRVDAIVVCPGDSDGVVPSLERANAAGIPVFTADIAATGGDVVAHVASDTVQGGRLAAERLAREIGGAGEVVIIDHPEVSSVQDRVRGFKQALAAWPDVELVGEPSAGGLRDRAHAIAEDVLQSRPDLAGIFAINDPCALGALRAVGDRPVAIVGFDATPEAREAIRRGSALKADVVQYPEEIGRRTIEAIVRHRAGEPVEPVIGVEVGIVDAASLAGDA